MFYRLTMHLRWRVLIVVVAAVAAATALVGQASAANHSPQPHRAFATCAQMTPAQPARRPGWAS